MTAPTGQALAGNVGSLAPGVLDKTGWSETVYRRLDEQETAEHARACARLRNCSGGFRLLVGRDLEERARMRAIIVGGGARLGRARHRARARRRVLRDAARAAALRRHHRDDAARSWPAICPAGCRSTGTGDELDRLALNLNAMLERIEALMRGLEGSVRQYRA